MTNGLDIVIAWAIFGCLVAVLAWIVLRRTNDQPMDELRRTGGESGAPPETARGDADATSGDT